MPVTINFDTKNYAMVEFPSASNGYKRMKIRSRSRKESIILNWQLANAEKKKNRHIELATSQLRGLCA